MTQCPTQRGSNDPQAPIVTTHAQRFSDPYWPTRLPVLNLFNRPDARLPGPRELPFVGVAPQLMRNPFDYLLGGAREHGDIFRVPVPFHDLVIVSHPDLVRQIFHDRKGTNYGYPDMPGAAQAVVGVPFPALDGDRYIERRNLLPPMFGKRFLARRASKFVEEMDIRLRNWERFADTDIINAVGQLLPIPIWTPSQSFVRWSLKVVQTVFPRFQSPEVRPFNHSN